MHTRKVSAPNMVIIKYRVVIKYLLLKPSRCIIHLFLDDGLFELNLIGILYFLH